MANPNQVKQYLGQWFQLGKKVLIEGGKTALLPETVVRGDRYSPEFEACWQRITSPQAGDCYLEGTAQTVAELLGEKWEIIDCARCEMPVPVQSLGLAAVACPCHDLPDWPNTELPIPRSPVDSDRRIENIRLRLSRTPSETKQNS
jgi:hypothetical protein